MLNAECRMLMRIAKCLMLQHMASSKTWTFCVFFLVWLIEQRISFSLLCNSIGKKSQKCAFSFVLTHAKCLMRNAKWLMLIANCEMLYARYIMFNAKCLMLIVKCLIIKKIFWNIQRKLQILMTFIGRDSRSSKHFFEIKCLYIIL